MSMNKNLSELPDKDYLYGNYQEAMDKRNNLAYHAACKSLDIGPEDDMQIITDNSSSGIGIKGLISIAAILAGSIIGGIYLMDREKEKPTEVKPPIQNNQSDQDTKYNLKFIEPREMNDG